jgi:hypothetical protein
MSHSLSLVCYSKNTSGINELRGAAVFTDRAFVRLRLIIQIMNKKTVKPEQRESGIHLADGAKPQPAIDPEAAVAAAVADIFCEMPEIVKAVIAKAKDGSYLHANFLFNFAGAENHGHDGDDQEAEEEESLVDILMKRLDEDALAEPHGLESTKEEKRPANGKY